MPGCRRNEQVPNPGDDSVESFLGTPTKNGTSSIVRANNQVQETEIPGRQNAEFHPTKGIQKFFVPSSNVLEFKSNMSLEPRGRCQKNDNRGLRRRDVDSDLHARVSTYFINSSASAWEKDSVIVVNSGEKARETPTLALEARNAPTRCSELDMWYTLTRCNMAGQLGYELRTGCICFWETVQEERPQALVLPPD
ncbi:hypothetical protein ARMSODRAFT_1062657 [Armillaria solidipes]|uniref:Uncharacterized protein n=1 Tax=Armillaria solidipes TaxID=1076256 RepID=A0A2H3ASC6_9AGAR|nr:hypothetical protein ARMSODRAFT_1062657 [Armillaria solidipes]